MSEAAKPKRKLQYKKDNDFTGTEKPEVRKFEVKEEDLKPNSLVAEIKEPPSLLSQLDLPRLLKEEEEKTTLTQVSDDNPIEEKKIKKKLNNKSSVYKPHENAKPLASISGPKPNANIGLAIPQPDHNFFASGYGGNSNFGYQPMYPNPPFMPQMGNFMPQQQAPKIPFPGQYPQVPPPQFAQLSIPQPQPLTQEQQSTITMLFGQSQAQMPQMPPQGFHIPKPPIQMPSHMFSNGPNFQRPAPGQYPFQGQQPQNFYHEQKRPKFKGNQQREVYVEQKKELVQLDTQKNFEEPIPTKEAVAPVPQRTSTPVKKTEQVDFLSNKATKKTEEKPPTSSKKAPEEPKTQPVQLPSIKTNLFTEETAVDVPPDKTPKEAVFVPQTSIEKLQKDEPQSQSSKSYPSEQNVPPSSQRTQEPSPTPSSHPLRIREEDIESFISNFSAELPADMKVLIRNTREVVAPAKPKYPSKTDFKDRDGRGGKHKGGPLPSTTSSKLEVKKPTEKETPQSKLASSQALPALSRTNFTDERLKDIKVIKETANDWIFNKMNDDEKIKQQRNLMQLLNKITADNFELISQTILEKSKDKEMMDATVDILINKAWHEPRYTKTYAQFVVRMVNEKFDWDKSPKRDYIKKKILNRVEEEYVEGFQKYYDFSKEIYNDESLNSEEKFEKLSKKKHSLIGNINFICELFSQNILSFFVLKIIVLYGIGNFIKEYIRTEREKDKFSIKEDYLEALLKIFENLGKLIEKKDNSIKNKVPKDSPADDIMLDDIEHMLANLADNTDRFLEKSKLDQKGKAIYSLTKIFFDFLEIALKLKIGARMQSLIENLKQFRNTGWVVEIKKVAAAKTLSEVKKEIDLEREELEGGRDDHEDFYDKSSRLTGESYRKRNKDSFSKPGKGKDYYPKKEKRGDGGSTQYVAVDARTKAKRYEELKKEALNYLQDNKGLTNPDEYKAIFLKSEGSKGKDLIRAYIETFAKHISKENSKKLLDFGQQLFEKNMVNENDFYNAIFESSRVFYLEYTDAPFLLEMLAEVIYRLWKETFIEMGKLPLFDNPEDMNEDELEEYRYYIQDLRSKIKKTFADNKDGELLKKAVNW